MTLVPADSILLRVILTPKQRKYKKARKREMRSRSGKETVPMWAIAARTMGRVKEIVGGDEGTRRGKRKPIDQTQDPRRL